MAEETHSEDAPSPPQPGSPDRNDGGSGSGNGSGSKDIAASFLAKNGSGQRIEVSAADSARILKRIDWAILPIMLAVYFLQGLDKATLAYASVFGLIEDTGLVGNQYSWLGSIVYIAQLAMQPLVSWFLVRLPIAKFISAMVFLWGVSLACMAAAHSFGGLLATRFFLGVFEASIGPSFVTITQMWWRRREQTVRTSYWYSMNGATNMFGSLITYALGHIPESAILRSYQIIFIFFGATTIIFSVFMLLWMPDSPIEAKFLKEEDKLIAIERVRMNQMGIASREWRYDHVIETLKDPKSWLWLALLFAISVPSGGISTFGPLIISTFGFNQFETILFNIPFGFVQLVATIGAALLAERIKMKGPVIACLCLPPIAGCAMLMMIPRDESHQAALLVGYYLMSIYQSITPLIYSWASQNTAGDTKKKCSTAMLFIGQSIGNIAGPMLYTQKQAPGYRMGLCSSLALYVAIILLVVVTSLYLKMLNVRHARKRVAMGKSAVIVDSSMDSPDEIAATTAAAATTAQGSDAHLIKNDRNAEEGEAAGNPAAVAPGEGVEQPGEKAFENLTDRDNEEFIYVY
ncbi:hypothetical protein M426DRAFT_15316 [Hypoxylon sp. CI-4A]|nr:hypothetical protein M426DRAFT_15316 [Hypoxylon sp. CI-4A]